MPLPTDPLLASQWHLNNVTPGLFDLNVFAVWNPFQGLAYTGAGTTTVVIDDGFDYNHPDFDNYDQGLDYDFEFSTLDPFGASGDAQGTAVAGIIGAAANGSGAVGVAYDTTLIGYRTYGFISDFWLQNVRESIAAAATNAFADVVNISQSISSDTASEFGLGYDPLRFAEIRASINTAVDDGRGGLGTTIVKSAGDARIDNYDVNADGWTSDTRQVVVAAVDQNGFVSSTSSFGAAILVSGFGTPGEVVTTDRVGADGFDADDFTETFSGTSAAAPMVAGVVALMYEANPGLGWRDVQTILGVSARHVGSEVGAGISGSELFAWSFNASGNWNGGGQHFSNDYGYGLVDALAAVRLAETWLITGTAAASSVNEFTNVMDVLNTSTLIPGGPTGLTFSGTAGFNDYVERVTVRITFATTWLADMEVYLISPDGTESLLTRNQAGSADYNGTWTFESLAFRGEYAAGTWSVRIVDTVSFDSLTVTDIIISTFGADTVSDRYIYTDEYSDYAGLFGHAVDVLDSNGGIDTVNASAVTSDSEIRLDGSYGIIDGIFTTFTGVENAIGGDGDDDLFGNTGANQLFGMRGDDILDGGDGADILDGGIGNDDLYGGGDEDTLRGGTGDDNLYGGGGVDNLDGGDGDDTLDGGDFTETLLGGSGNDTFLLRLFEGNDNFYGGDDTDTLDLSLLTSFMLGINLAAGTWGDATTVFGAAEEIENAIGSVQGDILTGNADDNRLDGRGGADTLIGGAGLDRLIGGAGIDTMDGGADSDIIEVDNAGDIIIEAIGGGFDTVRSSVTYTLGAGVEVERLSTTSTAGIGAINLTGNAFAQEIYGNNGANTLNGGIDTLRDILTGYSGNDIYVINSALDIVVEGVGGGTGDRVQTSVTFTLAADDNIEIMQTTNAALTTVLNLTGNGISQAIYGNAGANTLSGGVDALSDTLIGYNGNDIYVIHSINDVIVEGVGQGAADRVQSTVSFALAADDNIEILQTTNAGFTTAINLTGNVGGQAIYGNAGVNVLNGGLDTARDTLIGYGGNDTYVINSTTDLIVEAAGGGTADRAQTSVTFTLAADDDIEIFETTSAAGTVALGLTGNALVQAITGNAGGNTINGGLGNDTLTGLGGSDNFLFNTAINSATNHDTITDFNVAADTVQLENAIFTLLAVAGPMAIAFFKDLSLGGQDANDVIIYDRANGDLYYDTNGLTAGGQTLFADVTNNTALTAADFVVV